MKPRISFITLGVDDLPRALSFYRDGLGWPSDGIVGEEYPHGAVVFFELEGGLRLALWPRSSIAHDSGVAHGAASSTEFTLAYNVAERQEVDVEVERAVRCGAQLVKAPQPTFYGGYAGYFADPDGHLWEVAYNPQMLPGSS